MRLKSYLTKQPPATGILARQVSAPEHGHVPAIAVDFDGRIAEYNPSFDLAATEPRKGSREYLTRLHDAGIRLIVWTGRPDEDDVKGWLARYDILYDAYNENPWYDQGSRKVVADYYVDDKGEGDPDSPWKDIYRDIEERLCGPQPPRQPTNDLKALRVLSNRGQSEMRRLLHKALSYPETTLRRFLSEPAGGRVVLAPPKGKDRAYEKVKDDYEGDWGRLLDVVRCSVVADNITELRKSVKAVLEAGAVYARLPEDRLDRPLANGYRDYRTNYRLPCGIVCEVQYHTIDSLLERERDHGGYEMTRELTSYLVIKAKGSCKPGQNPKRDHCVAATPDAPKRKPSAGDDEDVPDSLSFFQLPAQDMQREIERKITEVRRGLKKAARNVKNAILRSPDTVQDIVAKAGDQVKEWANKAVSLPKKYVDQAVEVFDAYSEAFKSQFGDNAFVDTVATAFAGMHLIARGAGAFGALMAGTARQISRLLRRKQEDGTGDKEIKERAARFASGLISAYADALKGEKEQTDDQAPPAAKVMKSTYSEDFKTAQDNYAKAVANMKSGAYGTAHALDNLVYWGVLIGKTPNQIRDDLAGVVTPDEVATAVLHSRAKPMRRRKNLKSALDHPVQGTTTLIDVAPEYVLGGTLDTPEPQTRKCPCGKDLEGCLE